MARRGLSIEISAGVLRANLSASAHHHIDQMLFCRKEGYNWQRISHGLEPKKLFSQKLSISVDLPLPVSASISILRGDDAIRGARDPTCLAYHITSGTSPRRADRDYFPPRSSQHHLPTHKIRSILFFIFYHSSPRRNCRADHYYFCMPPRSSQQHLLLLSISVDLLLPVDNITESHTLPFDLEPASFFRI